MTSYSSSLPACNITGSSLKKRPRPVLRRWTGVFSGVCAALLAASAHAGSFTAGDLVVDRVGDGSTTLGSSATQVSLIELTMSGSNPAGGANVILMPTKSTANTGGLTDNGTSATQGHLNISANGQYVSLIGYDAPLLSSNPANQNATTYNRNIAQVDANGNMTIVARLTDFITTTSGNARGAVTVSGSSYYVVGNADSRLAITSSGVPTTSTEIDSAQNLADAVIATDSAGSNFLLFSSAKTVPWISNFTSFPATATTPNTLFGGTTLVGPTAFALLDADSNASTGAPGLGGLDTIYVVDTTAIKKFVYSGGAWVASGSIAGTYFGITAKVTGSGTVAIYATTANASNNSLVSYTDTTGTGAIPGGATATTIASAGANFAFRGVAFAPLPVTISTVGTLAALTTSQGVASSPTSFSVSGTSLSGSLAVIAPAGFEVSTSSGSGYSSSLSLAQTSGTVASTTIFVRLAAADAVGTYSGNVVCSSPNVATTYIATASSTVTGMVPTITVTGSASAVSGTYGTASPSTSFSASGSNLTNNIVVTAPAGFEISTSSGSGYMGTLTLTQSGSAVPATTIYARLTSAATAGAHSGNVTLMSTGATQQNEAIPSSTVSQLALTVSGAAVTTKPWDGTNAATITGTLVGVIGGDTVTLAGTGTFASTNDGTGIAVTSTSTLSGASASNYTLTQPTGLTGTILASDNLGSVTFGSGGGTIMPAFSYSNTSYTAGVSNNVASLNITPVADPSATSVMINGTPASNGSVNTVSLAVGANTVTIAVTQGGSTQTYTFTITRTAPFTPGNVVVQQADNGSIQNTTATLVEVDATATATQESPVQSIPLPGTAINSDPTQAQALRLNGSGGTTGYLATTNDGTLLAVVDANALNSTDLGQTTAADIDNRAVVTMSASGNLVFQAYYTGDGGVPSTGNQARAATSLDNVNWFVADKGGIYVTNSGTPATNPKSTANMLVTKSFGGQVYGFTAAAPGVSSVATSGGSIGTLSSLTGLSIASYTDFYLISSGVNGAAYDVCYVSLGSSATGGTINKYSLVSGAWVSNGSYTTNFGGRSMIAAGNGSGAVLYLTGGDGGTSGVSVVKVTDTAGWNSPISVTTANNVNLYTFASGATGPVPKGIAFAPLASPLPDLTIAASAPFIAGGGGNFNYTLTVANSGAANASGVTAQFTLPAGLSFVSATDNGGNGFASSSSNGVVTFTGGALNSGSSDTITVAVTGANGSYTVDAGPTPATGHGSAVINTSASTATPIAESNTGNNSSNVSAVTLVGSQPYLTVDTAGSSTAVANGNFTYTITAKNIGNSTATGAQVQFTLPAGLAYVSGTDNGSDGFTAAYNSGVVTFSGGALAASATDTLTVTVTATTSTYRIYTVNLPAGAATITSTGGNNNASTSTVATGITLPSGPDLVVTSTPNGPFQAGDAADSFTIFANNDGTASETQPIVVTGTLPTGFTFVSGAGTGWTVGVNGQVFSGTYVGTTGTGSGTPALVITGSVATNASGPLTVNLSGSSSNDAFAPNGTGSNTVNVGIATPITTAGSLIVSRARYTGSASTITVGQTLPNGAPATVSGAYPGLWTNETPDVSFGITAPIYMDVISSNPPSPIISSTLNSTNLTSLIKSQLGLDVTTSFSSKSEVGLNLTPDGKGVTFMAYMAPALTLDVSNANTPYHDDPTSPLATHGDFQHAVVQVDYLGNVQVTPVDAYSGDNSRNVILAQASDSNYYYYIAGSAGNSGAGVTGATMTMLAQCTGIQMIAPGAGGLTTAVGEAFGTAGSTTGYQLGYAGQPSDKTGKDMNLRGLTLNPFNNTLYASKGSGGSGVDTIYQIGSGIPSPATASSGSFAIPPGFPTTSGSYFPFGMWFANAHTLYVTDEGEVPSPVTYTSGTYTQAIPANNPLGGLQKWVNSNPDGSGTWSLAYTLQNGLNLGVPYSYTIGNGYPTSGNNPATGVPWQPANNGLRNMAAHDNGDGTVTIYAVTATISGETDFGADPNQLVSITDNVAATSLPGSESFTVLEEASGLDVLRGVALAQAAPVNSTLAAGNLSASGATLSGSLNPGGTDTHVYFQYGTTTAYGQTTAVQDLGNGSSAVPFSFNLTGLQAGTTYNYRLVTDGVTTYYSNQTFTTPAGVPAMKPWALALLGAGLVLAMAGSLKRKRRDGAC